MTDFNMYLDFNSREGYLEWAAQWKADYASISSEIKQIKHKIANENREKGFMCAWHELRSLQKEAGEMLSWRHGMKEEAARQVELRKLNIPSLSAR